MISKRCPADRESIYDITFCLVVCQLEVGDTCYPEFGIGDDICEIGTHCEASTQTCTVVSQGNKREGNFYCEKISDQFRYGKWSRFVDNRIRRVYRLDILESFA